MKSIAKGAFWSHSSLQLLWPGQQILNRTIARLLVHKTIKIQQDSLGLKPLPRNASKSHADKFGQIWNCWKGKQTRIGFSINVYSGILSPFVPIQANTSIKVTSSTYLLMFIIILRCKIMIKQVCTYFAVSYKGFTKLKLFYFSTFKIVKTRCRIWTLMSMFIVATNSWIIIR